MDMITEIKTETMYCSNYDYNIAIYMAGIIFVENKISIITK
jgi:hypothetical protein